MPFPTDGCAPLRVSRGAAVGRKWDPAALRRLSHVFLPVFCESAVVMERGVMSFSTEIWALARLWCMSPVLGAMALWYLSRADRLLDVARGRHT
jgi:hypothetical protein